MDNTRLILLFERYTTGSCSEEERMELMHLLAQSPRDPLVLQLMKDLWDNLPEQRSAKLDSTKANEILDSILEAEGAITPVPKRSRSFTFSRMAAVLAFLILAAVAVYYGKGEKPQPEAAISKVSSDTEHKFIKLPDGSTVILNAGSTLDYPVSFREHPTREVVLTGEGFFDIRHDPAKPFIVHTGRLKTTVLGTAFNIKADKFEKNITVTVRRGKVKVSDDTAVIGVLTSDQQITFDTERRVADQKPVDSKTRVAWAEQDIFFDDITLAEAVEQLEGRFGVAITFLNTALEECRFTASFVNGEDLEQVLQVICEFNHASYRKTAAGTIVIDGRGC